MDAVLIVLMLAVAWHLLRARYQRMHMALLASHLAPLQLERHMETLTQGYVRAIKEPSDTRQQQILDEYAQTERAVAAQWHTLAEAMQRESQAATVMGPFAFCVPYAERWLPVRMRDFRALLKIHAAGMRYAVDNEAQWDSKTRAFHLSAELYLFQHSCHWFCKSRAVADARLMVRHQVNHQKVLASVSSVTREAYQRWMAHAA